MTKPNVIVQSAVCFDIESGTSGQKWSVSLDLRRSSGNGGQGTLM